MSEPAAHPVPDHRAAHRAAHHEPDPGRLAWRVSDQQVRGQQSASRPAAAPHRQGEIRAAPHACLRGKHQRRLTTGLRPRAVRRSAARASCACAQRAPPARRGCACAGGIRASWHDGDCSAETYACSLRAPDAVLGSRPTARAAASALRRPGGQSTRVGAAIPGGQTGRPQRPGTGRRERAANQRVTGTLPFTERAARGKLRLWRTAPGLGAGARQWRLG
jgi:hypothetical protein